MLLVFLIILEYITTCPSVQDWPRKYCTSKEGFIIEQNGSVQFQHKQFRELYYMLMLNN